MKIQEQAPLSPKLNDIGIQIRQIRSTQPPITPTQKLNPQEGFEFIGLQLQDFDHAYLVDGEGESEPLSLDPQVLQQSKLLDSLNRVQQNPNLELALEVNSKASEIIQAMRQAHGLADTKTHKLIISGSLGSLELDLRKLEPEALKAAFDGYLIQSNADKLLDQHLDISSLTQRVRAGFGPLSQMSELQAQDWISLVQNPSLSLEALFKSALGFNPLNEESSVRALLGNPEDNPQANPTPPSSLILDEKVKALIDLANRLEQELDLTPLFEGPNILDLLKDFLAILQQLDQDLNAIVQSQNQKKKLDRKILASYAALLHSNLRFHQEQRQNDQDSAQNRAKILLNQALLHTQALSWLVIQIPPVDNQQVSVQNIFEQLKKRTIAVVLQ